MISIMEVSMAIYGATSEEMQEYDQGWKWGIFVLYLHSGTLKLIQAYGVKQNPNVDNLIYSKVMLKANFLSNMPLGLCAMEKTW